MDVVGRLASAHILCGIRVLLEKLRGAQRGALLVEVIRYWIEAIAVCLP
jgi:hypothetical protein